MQIVLVNRVIAAGAAPEKTATVTIGWGLAALSLFALLTARPSPFTAAVGMGWSWQAGGPGSWDTTILAIIVGLAILPTCLAILSLNKAIQLLGPGRASLMATTEPLFAGLWATLLLHEHLAWSQWLGALILLAGIGLLAGEAREGAVVGERLSPDQAGSNNP